LLEGSLKLICKESSEQTLSMESAPRDGQVILIYGRLGPTNTRPDWVRGRFVEDQGWCFGPDTKLTQIHDALGWTPV
jgi:hypothetical protein